MSDARAATVTASNVHTRASVVRLPLSRASDWRGRGAIPSPSPRSPVSQRNLSDFLAEYLVAWQL